VAVRLLLIKPAVHFFKIGAAAANFDNPAAALIAWREVEKVVVRMRPDVFPRDHFDADRAVPVAGGARHASAGLRRYFVPHALCRVKWLVRTHPLT
jgi:hypothetical protein